MFKKYSEQAFFLHDDSYFNLTYSTFNYNSSCYTFNVSMTKYITKSDTKAKFEDKILEWIGWIRKARIVCSSESLGSLSRGNDIMNKCIRHSLIGYTRNGGYYIFSSALISIYYCKIVLIHFHQQNSTFEENSDKFNWKFNQLSSPILSPVCAKHWKVDNIKKKINRLKYCFKIMYLNKREKL